MILTASSVWFITDQIIEYSRFNVISSTRSAIDLTTEFPVVTLCNFNFFNTREGKKYINDLEKEFLKSEGYIKVNNGVYSKSKIKLIQLRLDHAKSVLYKNTSLFSNISLIQSFGLELKDIMLSCYFGSEPCNYTDFEYFFDKNYGNCYKYNSGFNGSIERVITSGGSSGLQLGLYVGHEDLNDKITYSNGIYLTIQNKSFKGLLPTNGFNIPTGRATSIGNFIVIISFSYY